MKSCFKGIIYPLAIAAFFFSITFNSCTSVDDTLGLGLLPKDQEMYFNTATLDGIRSFAAISDSIPTSQRDLMIIGKYKTDGYGQIDAGFVSQFFPSSFKDGDYFYGYKPHFDSIKLYLGVSAVYGDTTVNQKFYVYQLKESPVLDSTYFASFPVETIVDYDDPLFAFYLKGQKAGEVASPELTIYQSGQKFIQELIDVDPDTYLEPDTVFQKMFRGLYIAPSTNPSEAPDESALYIIYPLTNATYASTYGIFSNAYFTIYTHSHVEHPDEDDKVFCTHNGVTYARADTLFAEYSFEDNASYFNYPNTTINVIKHDYSSYPAAPSYIVDPGKFIDYLTYPEGNPHELETFYVQGMLGVSGFLDFGQEFMDQLDQLTYYEGDKLPMMVNRAKMYVWLDDADDYKKLDNAPSRLGMYYDYSSYYPLNIPDYMYIDEAYYSYTSTYGGFLNRSKGYYEMDISMYVRALANKPGETQKEVWLSPANTIGVMFSPTEVSLLNPKFDANGDPHPKRITVELAYTLLRKSETQ